MAIEAAARRAAEAALVGVEEQRDLIAPAMG